MEETKKMTLRFNLENSQDKKIWAVIQKQKNKTEYIKNLIRTGIEQKEQQSVLKELSEIKEMIKEINVIDTSAFAGVPQEIKNLQNEQRQPKQQIPETLEMETMQPETMEMEESSVPPVIDADVMNFLDNL